MLEIQVGKVSQIKTALIKQEPCAMASMILWKHLDILLIQKWIIFEWTEEHLIQPLF